MRRGPLLAAASASGLVGVVLLHAGGTPSLVVSPVGNPPRGTAPTTTAPATGPTGSLPPTTVPAPTALRTAVGTTEQYGYGELAVKVTVRGSKIVDVAVSVLQTAEQYSQSLAEQVIPTLRGEVLSAQSARINGISGATYTSEAYAYSLQSALDTLHVK
jgi:uncharacterized protein with FMN-binding domain